MAKNNYGGQAVMEGVVMNGPGGKAIACRKEDDRIVYKTEVKKPLKERYPLVGWPIIRGFVAFLSALIVGIKDISWSAAQAGEGEEQLENKDIVLAIVLAAAMAIGLFVVVPVLIGNFAWAAGGDFARSLTEGFIRLGIFLAYVLFISRMPDIQRLFAYHGAEHKTINAVEAGEPLTPENVMKHSRIHTRCGTSFLLMSMLLMIIIFTFVGQTDALHRILIKVITMPLVAGVAYELFRLPLRFPDNPLVKALTAPGLWMQKITTNEPSKEQLEVAITSMIFVPGFRDEYAHLIVVDAVPVPISEADLKKEESERDMPTGSDVQVGKKLQKSPLSQQFSKEES
ncbi:MAG: DUF1385 domain-containing protein [Bacillota bacterium]|jgi:uncharacterized protein YqhQ